MDQNLEWCLSKCNECNDHENQAWQWYTRSLSGYQSKHLPTRPFMSCVFKPPLHKCHTHTHMPTICRASVILGPALASVKLNPQRLWFGNVYYVMKTHGSTCQFHHSSSCIAGICCGIGWLRFLWLFLHAKGVGSTMPYKALEHFMAWLLDSSS